MFSAYNKIVLETGILLRTVMVPRLKLLAIPAGLRWSIVVLGFALPWAVWLIFVVVATFRSMGPKGAQENVFQFSSDTPPSTGAIVSTLVILYLGLRVPYEISSLMQGPRPPTLHSALAWSRFAFAVLAPILVLGSARRFKAALVAAFMCCSRRRSSVAPPEEPPSQGASKVPASVPVLFQTPGGLYLRRVRYNHHPTAPGFTYTLCDLDPQGTQKASTIEKMDMFMRSSAFLN